MFESTVTMVAAGVAGLTTVYWVCLILGGGLLLISSIVGSGADTDIGGDASFDADINVDANVGAPGDFGGVGHPHHAGPSSLSSWLSMQFAVFFLAMFGLTGVAMTHLTDTAPGVTAACAVAGGMIVGQAAHQILRRLRLSSGDSTPQPADYVNKPARVTIPMSHQDKGEVVLRIGAGDRHIPAVAQRPEASFAIGDDVAVVRYDDGVAQVISKEEYEFLTLTT